MADWWKRLTMDMLGGRQRNVPWCSYPVQGGRHIAGRNASRQRLVRLIRGLGGVVAQVMRWLSVPAAAYV